MLVIRSVTFYAPTSTVLSMRELTQRQNCGYELLYIYNIDYLLLVKHFYYSSKRLTGWPRGVNIIKAIHKSYHLWFKPECVFTLLGNYEQVTALKSEKTKVLLSVGGPYMNDTTFSVMVSNPENRQKFVNNSVEGSLSSDLLQFWNSTMKRN